MRYIGIQHRVKKTADEESRPTLVAIVGDGNKPTLYSLETEQDEFDFLHGCFATSFRDVAEGDDLLTFSAHHIKWRSLKEGEDSASIPTDRIRTEEGKLETVAKVPASFDGLSEGDFVSMVLGGSGDYFAYALARKAEIIGAEVHRVPPFLLKHERGEGLKTDDALLLANLLRDKSSLFYKVKQRDLDLIKVRIKVNDRRNTQRDRIACAHRVRMRSIGEIFCSEEGLYPQGQFEKIAQDFVANSAVLNALVEEEKRVTQALTMAVENLDVYTEIFKGIEGVGPAIAGPIIAYITDIRRFSTDAKLKAYCGVHVMPDGTFPRRRRGVIANWPGGLRQAVYLFGMQCVRRKDSEWGKYYRLSKLRLREKHPEPIVENGKKRYTNGHIHKMAIWRTLTRFIEWLFTRWWELENKANKGPKVLAIALKNAIAANDTATGQSEAKSEDQLRAAD